MGKRREEIRQNKMKKGYRREGDERKRRVRKEKTLGREKGR